MARRVLVTDGDQRAALATVRSLGRAGYEVYVCSPRKRSLAGASRFARAQARVASALEDPAAFATDVRRLCDAWSIDALIPVTEESLLTLLAPDAGIHAVIPFPTLEAFQGVSDKARLLTAAQSVGLCVPEQVVVQSAADLGRLRECAFPLVLKPSRSVREQADGRHKLSVQHAATFEAAKVLLEKLPAATFPVLAQRRVMGPGMGIFLLLWEGELRAVFAHRRLREKPPAGGVSVYCESVVAPPGLVEKCVKLLRQFNWTGVAMVELKVDLKTGTPYVMEVNGRFWGSLQLAIDAGVDFPRLLMECATGKLPAAPPDYDTEVRSRWFWGEVDHLIARLRRSRHELHLPPDAVSRWRALFDFVIWRRNERSDVFRFTDPGPFLRESILWLSRS